MSAPKRLLASKSLLGIQVEKIKEINQWRRFQKNINLQGKQEFLKT